MKLLAKVALISALALGSCACGAAQGVGGSSAGTADVSSPSDGGISAPPDTTVIPDTNGDDPGWAKTSFPGLTEISSAELRSLPFTPATSDKLGNPVGMFKPDSGHLPSGWSALLIEYGADATYGDMRVIEYSYPVGDVESTLAQEIAGSCSNCAVSKLIQLNSNVAAALNVGPSVTNVIWLENGLEIQLMGPSDTLSGDEAVSAANDLAASLPSG